VALSWEAKPRVLVNTYGATALKVSPCSLLISLLTCTPLNCQCSISLANCLEIASAKCVKLLLALYLTSSNVVDEKLPATSKAPSPLLIVCRTLSKKWFLFEALICLAKTWAYTAKRALLVVMPPMRHFSLNLFHISGLILRVTCPNAGCSCTSSRECDADVKGDVVISGGPGNSLSLCIQYCLALPYSSVFFTLDKAFICLKNAASDAYSDRANVVSLLQGILARQYKFMRSFRRIISVLPSTTIRDTTK